MRRLVAVRVRTGADPIPAATPGGEPDKAAIWWLLGGVALYAGVKLYVHVINPAPAGWGR